MTPALAGAIVPARHVPPRQLRMALLEARALARRAYGRARGAGRLSSVVVDKLWADTLLAVDGQPSVTATEMLRRTEHLFVLIEDRASWPL